MEVGLSLGSNIGDRLKHLKKARGKVLAIPGIRLVAAAPVYECEPFDVPVEFVQQLFLNSVLIIETSVPIEKLIVHLRHIERGMGRKPALRNAPRIIDIDIIYADGLQVNEADLVVPHPRWFLRRFVLQPLSDVRPNLRVPGQSGRVLDVLSGLSDTSKVERFVDGW